MTSLDRFLLQADSFIIIMALIVYLFKALNRDNRINNDAEEKSSHSELSERIMKIPQIIQTKTGLTKGEAWTVGIEDDEVACAIMAAVSTASMIPLSSIKIKSIRAIES